MNTSAVIQACQQLVKQGKTPSVALIKTRLSKPAPLPVIITGLKQFQANPNAATECKETSQTDSAQETSNAEMLAQISKLVERISQLESKVEKLTFKVDELTKDKNG